MSEYQVEGCGNKSSRGSLTFGGFAPARCCYAAAAAASPPCRLLAAWGLCPPANAVPQKGGPARPPLLGLKAYANPPRSVGKPPGAPHFSAIAPNNNAAHVRPGSRQGFFRLLPCSPVAIRQKGGRPGTRPGWARLGLSAYAQTPVEFGRLRSGRPSPSGRGCLRPPRSFSPLAFCRPAALRLLGSPARAGGPGPRSRGPGPLVRGRASGVPPGSFARPLCGLFALRGRSLSPAALCLALPALRAPCSVALVSVGRGFGLRGGRRVPPCPPASRLRARGPPRPGPLAALWAAFFRPWPRALFFARVLRPLR